MAINAPKQAHLRVARSYAAYLSVLVVAASIAACDAPGGDAVNTRDPAPGESDSLSAPGETDSLPGAGSEAIPSSSIAAGYLAEARFADADLERGELLSYACIVCHTLGRGEEHMIGPNLHGIFGRPAASAPDFAFSDALQQAGVVWTPAELDVWLARPDDFVPGNLMVFAGIYSVSDRTDLLAYLLRETAADQSTTTR